MSQIDLFDHIDDAEPARVSVAEAKARLSALLAAVAHNGARFVIERHHTPVAALVPMDDLARLRAAEPASPRPRGALALAGLWGDLEETAIDAVVTDIYAERARDVGRPVDLEE